MTSMKISNFLTPSPPCHIHDHATYQYSCPLFDYPLPPSSADVIDGSPLVPINWYALYYIALFCSVLFSQHSNPFFLHSLFVYFSLSFLLSSSSIVCDLRNGFCQGPCSPQWHYTKGKRRVPSLLQSCLSPPSSIYQTSLHSYRETCKQGPVLNLFSERL